MIERSVEHRFFPPLLPGRSARNGGGSRKCRGELLRLEELSFGVIIGGYTVSVGKMVLEAVDDNDISS